MKFRSLAVCAAVAVLGSTAAQAQTEIQWWHSMTGGLNDWVVDIANGFNASQKDFKIVPTYKGTYDESMTASIAAFRAGNAPHILQVYEVGTATMMAAKGAIVPVGKVMQNAGYKFDPKAYIPAVVGYYTAPQRRNAELPLQQLDHGAQLQQGPVQEGRSGPQQAARHLARTGVGRRQAQGLGRGLPVHHKLAGLDAA